MPGAELIGPKYAMGQWLKAKVGTLPTLHMVKKQKQKYKAIQAKILGIAEKEGIRFDKTSSSKNFVKLQGDAEHNSVQSLIKRVNRRVIAWSNVMTTCRAVMQNLLKQDPRVVRAIDRLWNVAEMVKTDNQVNCC
jgi:hypothetical protein